jgi:hypothetical protein
LAGSKLVCGQNLVVLAGDSMIVVSALNQTM